MRAKRVRDSAENGIKLTERNVNLPSLLSIYYEAQRAFVVGRYWPVSDGLASTALVVHPDATTPFVYDKRALYGT